MSWIIRARGYAGNMVPVLWATTTYFSDIPNWYYGDQLSDPVRPVRFATKEEAVAELVRQRLSERYGWIVQRLEEPYFEELIR